MDTTNQALRVPDFSGCLAAFAAKQKANIACYELSDGLVVWIRKAGARNPAWRYALLGMITRPLRLGVLKPVPNLGGEKAISVEEKRLRELKAAGISVPEVLAHQADALMLSHLDGKQLDTQIEQEARGKHLTAWNAGLNAIGEVHRKGQFLSQAFARNIMISGKDVSFLDFEDDPSEVLTLAECQSRDWLCYLHSTSLMLKKYGLLERAAALWHDKLLTQPDEIQYLVTQTAKPIRWMHSLSHSRWGRDMLRLAAVAGLFYLADLYF